MSQSQQVRKRGAMAGCLWTSSPLFPHWPSGCTTKQIILHSSTPDMNYEGCLAPATPLPFFCTSLLSLESLSLFWSLIPLGMVDRAARLCEKPSCLSACWQGRGFVKEMKRGAAFRLGPLLTDEPPTTLFSSASSARHLQLEGICKGALCPRRAKRASEAGAFIFVYCLRECVHATLCLLWCLNNEVSGLQWHHRSLIMKRS